MSGEVAKGYVKRFGEAIVRVRFEGRAERCDCDGCCVAVA